MPPTVPAAAQQLGCSPEVTDVGHARADEGFVNVRVRHFGQQLGGIGIVGAADDGLFDRWQEFRTSTCGNSRPAGCRMWAVCIMICLNLYRQGSFQRSGWKIAGPLLE